MKSIKDIVIDVGNSVSDKHFGKENVQETLRKFSKEGKLSLDSAHAASIEISTQYSNTVLYEVLSEMEKEGYFNQK